MKLLLTLSSLLLAVDAGVRFGGVCPDILQIPSVPYFNPQLYTGRWYEIRRDKWTIYEIMGTCVTADYSDAGTGYIKVANRGWYWWLFFSYFKIEGWAKTYGTVSKINV